jgi:hypothetical protein
MRINLLLYFLFDKAFNMTIRKWILLFLESKLNRSEKCYMQNYKTLLMDQESTFSEPRYMDKIFYIPQSKQSK